ncbi:MAG: flagellar hook protein FlgE [Campylobacterales bacterium]|nr:flagellar hook protein FlgE [Campylobacterales bacterium]
MNSSFYNGISGIKSQQFGLDVWADNISNISTIGYKGATPEFSTVFATTLANSYFDPTANSQGLGSRAQTTSLNMSQGIFQNTDNVFDLSIGGEGWFGVQGLEGQSYYTRAGAFSVDYDGNLVDANGNYLLGTLGGNITTTTLSDRILNEFGTYYKVSNTRELGTPYSIGALEDITLSNVENQSKINLPDILYFPPEATTYVKYQANLNPKINVGNTQIDLDTLDIGTPIIDTTNETLSISGTIANTSALQNPQSGDIVILSVTDENGKSINISAKLSPISETDSTLVWSFSDSDISSLDTATNISVSAKLQTEQEIPNVEHFTTEIISPEGEKNFIDMTFTKSVPQSTLETTWDAQIQILSYYEDYEIQTYDPNVTYDPTLYDVNLEANQVTKIYDPTLYKVDLGLNKVYEIIDSQSGDATFSGAGELLVSNMPTLSNSGTPLTINIGTPYAEENGVIVSNGYDGMISNVDLDKARYSEKDGYVEGLLKAYGMDERGNVIAEFTNGRSAPVAKIAIYHFMNDQGLEKVTSTLFSTSANSGQAIFYTDANGNPILGSQIYSNRLESSNVSMATALTELIVMQKAFDASSKSITTSDQMIKNAINMKA